MRWPGILLVACSLPLAGCFTDPDIVEIVDAIAWEMEPAQLEPDVELRLGDGSLGLLRWICGWSDDCEEFEDLLSGVDEVHLGVYDIHGRRGGSPLRMDPMLRDDLAAEGWEFVVSVRDRNDESAFVLARYDDRGVYGMLIISQDHRQLVVARLDGDLDKALHRAAQRDEEFLLAVRDH